MASPEAKAPALNLLDRWKSARAAAADKRLSRVELATHFMILDYMNSVTGEAWPSADTLARDVGATTRAVRKCRHRLVEFGHLIESTEVGKTNRYRLPTPAPACTPAKGCTPEPQFTPELAFTPEPQFTPPLNHSSVTPELAGTSPLNASSPDLAYELVSKNQLIEPVEKKAIGRATRSKVKKPVDDSFSDFWKAYPAGRRVKRPAAEKAWAHAKGEKHVTAILADLSARMAVNGEWHDREIKFIPHPTTYLRNAQWMDEWTPTETLGDKVRRAAEEFADFEFGGAFGAKADEMNAAAAARLARFNGGDLS